MCLSLFPTTADCSTTASRPERFPRTAHAPTPAPTDTFPQQNDTTSLIRTTRRGSLLWTPSYSSKTICSFRTSLPALASANVRPPIGVKEEPLSDAPGGRFTMVICMDFVNQRERFFRRDFAKSSAGGAVRELLSIVGIEASVCSKYEISGLALPRRGTGPKFLGRGFHVPFARSAACSVLPRIGG